MDECRHIARLLAFNRRTSNISLICQCTNVWGEKVEKIFKIHINEHVGSLKHTTNSKVLNTNKICNGSLDIKTSWFVGDEFNWDSSFSLLSRARIFEIEDLRFFWWECPWFCEIEQEKILNVSNYLNETISAA